MNRKLCFLLLLVVATTARADGINLEPASHEGSHEGSHEIPDPHPDTTSEAVADTTTEPEGGLSQEGGAECGAVEGLGQTGHTETTITIEWDIAVPPLKYRLTISDLINVEFLCSSEHCSYDVTGLSACHTYKLSLVAVCDVTASGEDVSDPSEIEGNTAFTVPGAVGDLTDDGSQLQWSAPTDHPGCVTGYQVCYTSDFSKQTECVTVSDTVWVYSELNPSGCDTFSVSVSAMTGDDQLGPASDITLTEAYGVPGAPTNYEVSFLSEDDLLLKWDLPIKNPACVASWSITYGPVDNTFRYDLAATPSTLVRSGAEQQFTAEIYDLLMCSNYSVAVAAVSVEREIGPSVVDYKATEDTAPAKIPNVNFESGVDQIVITWGDGTVDGCLANIQICYSNPVTADFECEVTGGGDGGYGNYTLRGLSPCVAYSLAIDGVSPDGTAGQATLVEAATADAAPGPVQNLRVTGEDSNSIDIAYDKPTEYPECAQEYVVGYTNLADTQDQRAVRAPTQERSSDLSDTLNGLDACADYKIDVWAVSPGGQQGEVQSVFDTTDGTDPGPPRNLQAIEAQADGVTLLWYAPEERFCVERYQAHFYVHGLMNDVYIWYDPEDPHAEQFVHTFASDELKSCTDYTLDLEAYNSGLFHGGNIASVDVKTACD